MVEKVDVRLYRVIYEAIDDVKAMEGLLEPEFREVVFGHAQVRATFKIPKAGVVAGSYVTDGKIARSSRVRLVRDGIVIHDGKISSLKRFKDDAREVAAGFECGIGIEGWNDVRVGDVIEAYGKEAVSASSRPGDRRCCGSDALSTSDRRQPFSQGQSGCSRASSRGPETLSTWPRRRWTTWKCGIEPGSG